MTAVDNQSLRTRVSIVMPVYNEAETLNYAYEKIRETMKDVGPFEWLLVDDGSTDESRRIIRSLAEKNPNISYVFFSRNFGHQVAVRAGVLNASGDCVIVMDADLQHPVDLIPSMVDMWRGDGRGRVDIVLTKRKADPSLGVMKNITSKGFYKFLGYLSSTEVIPGLADFYLLDRSVVEVIRGHNEASLYMRGLVSSLGFSRSIVEYQPRERHAGKSKYNLSKMLKLGAWGVLGATIRPLRLSIVLSGIVGVLTLLFAAFALYAHFIQGQTMRGWTSVIIVLSTIGSMQLFVLGVIGEYLGRVVEATRARPHFIVQESQLPDVEGA